MKKLLATILALVLIISIVPTELFSITASAATSGYYTYTVENDEVIITECNTSISGNVTIPSVLGGYPVTSIGCRAFFNCSRLESITIPNSVTSIASNAFLFCGLTSITIPDSVTSIGMGAFYGTKYYYDKNNWTDDILYIGKHLIYADNITDSYQIKPGTKTIAGYAFENCRDLTSITIPDSVTSIGDGAFSTCRRLKSITIPDGVTSIGTGAFMYCYNLENITIPNSVTSVGEDAFLGCDNLEGVYITDLAAWCNIEFIDIPSSASCGYDSNPLYIAEKLYINGKLATDITIPDGVVNIGPRAFLNCKNLSSVTIPDSITNIGDYTFGACDALANIYYKGTVEDKNNISIGLGNEKLENAIWHYNFSGITATKGTLTGNIKFGFNTPIVFEDFESATAYGVEVSRSADGSNPVDIQFAEGDNTVVGISNISLYNITREYYFKPYAISDGIKVYGKLFTSSYAEFLVSKKDHATNGAKVRNILDTYAAATGMKVYEGQVPDLESAPSGNWVASNPYTESANNGFGLRETNPVQGSLSGGKLRVNFNLPTNATNNGVLVYKSGNEFNANDISNASANITFAAGDLRSIDITNIAFANIAEQYTFVPYEYDTEFESYTFGKVSKVSFADFVAYALNNGSASQKAQAYGICKAYKAAYGKDLCEIVE